MARLVFLYIKIQTKLYDEVAEKKILRSEQWQDIVLNKLLNLADMTDLHSFVTNFDDYFSRE